MNLFSAFGPLQAQSVRPTAPQLHQVNPINNPIPTILLAHSNSSTVNNHERCIIDRVRVFGLSLIDTWISQS